MFTQSKAPPNTRNSFDNDYYSVFGDTDYRKVNVPTNGWLGGIF